MCVDAGGSETNSRGRPSCRAMVEAPEGECPLRRIRTHPSFAVNCPASHTVGPAGVEEGLRREGQRQRRVPIYLDYWPPLLLLPALVLADSSI